MVRLRDILGTEIRGLYEQTLNRWMNRAPNHLHDVGKKLGRQVEEHLGVRAIEVARHSARERIELQDKLKALPQLDPWRGCLPHLCENVGQDLFCRMGKKGG